MDRRRFIYSLTLAGLSWTAMPALADSLSRARRKNSDKPATTKYIFSQTVKSMQKQGFASLPIGDLMNQIGLLLVGTPYVGGTLEGDGPEVCRIDLTGLDCVTFFENCLDMARIIKKNRSKFDDMTSEVTYTRYRDGQLVDYTSRLHYTADWIDNNIKKRVVKDVTPDMNGQIFPLRVDFMSKHPQYYQPLKDDSAMTQKIATIEQRINATVRTYIPKDKISAIEPLLQNGDIIAISTSKEGLDYSHTGMISKAADGVARFLHASSQKKKVVLDDSISVYVGSVKAHTGITVVRPLEL